MATEIWKPVVGNSNYEVSDLGRVRSVTRTINKQVRPGRILSPAVRKSPTGRPVRLDVQLGRGVMRKVHRIVLEAFVGPCPEGCEGCHVDGDPTNNRPSNLRWDSHRENMRDLDRHGTKVNPPTLHGEMHPQSRLTVEAVLAIRAEPVRRGAYTKLGNRYGVSGQTIKRVIARKAWCHVEAGPEASA